MYELHETLRGHEMVVACTNNKAAENVSRELPLSAQVADDLDELNYFKTVSDVLSGSKGATWGLIAAVLGKSSNRRTFKDKAWKDEDSGLKEYFLSFTKTKKPVYKDDKNGNPIIPNVIKGCDPPENLEEAKKRWVLARKSFTEALKKAEEVTLVSQKAYKWQKRINEIQDQLNQIKEKKNAQQQIKQDIAKLTSEQKTIEAKMHSVKEQLKKLVTPSLWKKSHEDQQLFSPNFTLDAHKIRDEVFVEAIRLHKAFIDASAKQMRQNLAVFFKCLNGKPLPDDESFLLPHLWSSFFLLTPVISTTFSSVSLMLKELPPESIGWLLIDEAGQATPQAAIGAILRAQRFISVGDPLQIEPFVSLPEDLVKGVAKYYRVNPDRWMAPEASVQTVSDAANQYGTTIERGLGDMRIGMPLLVHRRCEDPMFNISNVLAYDRQMVKATIDCKSDITQVFKFKSKSIWFNMQGKTGGKAGKWWCPEEGEFVARMLLFAFKELKCDPGIFVISPFRDVADRMKKLIADRMKRLMKNKLPTFHGVKPEDWIKENIGTVHTFQGKEAKAVILLLGVPADWQEGSRDWATKKVNILNVAVSRAKQNFYVVGNKNNWGDKPHMKLFSELPTQPIDAKKYSEQKVDVYGAQ